MTGREKIQAAFSKEGTDEFPAVLCYEDIYIRDHWRQITKCPWWYGISAEMDKQIVWYKEVTEAIGQDWFYLPASYTKEDRENIHIQEKPDGLFRTDKRTKREDRLYEPKIGGECRHEWNKPQTPDTPEDIDRIFSAGPQTAPENIMKNGRKDLADRLLGGVCADLCPLVHIISPLQSCVSVWGFEGFMLMTNDNPELIKYTCERFADSLANEIREAEILGSEVIWIEECYLDMISPYMFRELNMPYITRLVEMIRSAGMKSVYYHTGDPSGKIEQIISAGADAVSFEESKKNFRIDIEDIADAVRGRCAVLGNLDATTFLPVCTNDELKSEVTRLTAAGRRNKNKFIVSMGSPVTPGTPVEKVRLYCDLVHQIGK
ncbi:MAG: uroporphyrinogen decarboxylase family protein [Oscillospiraceae bacterium]|nr:uroporphyrinogen decarboxylase family protein [Oscillospiraceae bacterium]